MNAPAPPVIVLAAGKGERAGGPKGLVEVRGRPWLLWQLEGLAAAGLERIVVVLASAWDEHLAAMPWVGDGGAEMFGARVLVARNPAPERGAFSSLQCGIDGLPTICAASRSGCTSTDRWQAIDAAFVLPVDVPSPPPDVVTTLLHALAEGADAAVPVHAGRGGHPVLCGPALLAHLAALDPTSPDARLDLQLRRCNVARPAVSSPIVLANWNTRKDWEETLGATLRKT